MEQEQKLERILRKAGESDSFREKFAHHLLNHETVAERIIEYGLKKLENGSFYKIELFESVNEIFNILYKRYPSLNQKYSERISKARHILTYPWNTMGWIN